MTTITETIAAIRAALQESRDACAPPSLDGVYLLRDSASALCDGVEQLTVENAALRAELADSKHERAVTVDRLTARVMELETAISKHNYANINGVDMNTHKKNCYWFEDGDNIYATECGHLWEFIDGNIRDNGAKYCPYCGGEIVEDEE